MEKNKYTLITIIALLVIILPLTVYGTYTHIMETTNFKRQFRYRGKLWFYDGKKLLGTYNCVKDRCSYARYRSGPRSTLIQNNYAFIADDDKVFLYNIKGGAIVAKYDGVDANVDSNSYYVMKKDNDGNELWGAIEIVNDVKNKVEPKYESIRYLNGKYIVSENGNNTILRAESTSIQEELFSTTYSIKDFNDNFIIVNYETSSCLTCTDIIKKEMLYDYNNKLYFESRGSIDEITFVSDFILLKEDNNYNLFKINDDMTEQFIDGFYYDGDEKIVYGSDEFGNIQFYAGSELQKTIEFNH